MSNEKECPSLFDDAKLKAWAEAVKAGRVPASSVPSHWAADHFLALLARIETRGE